MEANNNKVYEDYTRDDYKAILTPILEVYINKLVMFEMFDELRSLVNKLMKKIVALSEEYF
ncbi:MAG: hypothetical protein IJ542_02525 [Clostridia bacterium]|nr:hypothetical protein [Clostridia bacterium]